MQRVGITKHTEQDPHEVNTEKAVVFYLGSLYAELSQLTDKRDARGILYQVVNLLISEPDASGAA